MTSTDLQEARGDTGTTRRSMRGRALAWYSRRAFGQEMDPMTTLDAHPSLQWLNAMDERRIQGLHALDGDLAQLAQMASAVDIGCSWCIDFGYFLAHRGGMSPEKIQDVPRWQESTQFTELERDVLEFTRQATATPAEVDPDLRTSLCGRLGEPALLELAYLVAVENRRSRFNASMGLHSQGFSDACRIDR